MRFRGASQALLAAAGITRAPHPAVVHFARTNGISVPEVEAMVDEVHGMCAEQGVDASVEALIDALGTVVAFHKAGEEIRRERGQ